MENLASKSPEYFQPRFSDGELNFWPKCQSHLQRFDHLPDPEYQGQINRIEEKRNKFINALSGYAKKISCSFTVTPPELVVEAHGAINDIWAHIIEADIVQIPRFVLERRPRGKEFVPFRREIPAVFILVNMAHEVSHLERRRKRPEIYQKLFNESSRGERHKINITPEIKAEEIATDKRAYRLLKKLGVPITPETFVAQIPRDDKMPTYREEIMEKLREI